jgi:1,4-dihydroxy-2-naphthoate octaprenyltransferase
MEGSSQNPGRRALAWLRLLRLQFYPMAWVAYTVGALAARHRTGAFSPWNYWSGYLCLVLIEALTVISNEWFDQGTDRLNRNAGPFNGGSRVLVEGDLAPASVRGAMIAAALLVAGSLAGLALTLPDGARPGLVLVAALALLAPGYTVPPLRFCYRGLGELDVGLTHGPVAILCGAWLQSGPWRDPFPWLIGLPLLFATLAAIVLSGIPDHDADRAVGKRTLAVLLGPRGAALAALGCAAGALVCAAVWYGWGLYGGRSGDGLLLALPHGLGLVWAIGRFLRRGAPCTRIDGLMVLALTYILWFGLIPLARLA